MNKDIERVEERMELIDKVLKRVGTYTDCNNLTKQIKMMLNVSSFNEIPFDRVRPYYFCFNNKCFNLEMGKIGQPMDILPNDYITQTTGYDWKEPTAEEYEYVSDIIQKIFVDEDIRNTYLSILFSAMIGKQFEKFVLANGQGRNGKGVLNDLFAVMLGDNYFYKGNINSLTGRDFGNGQGASPDVVAMNLKRCIIWDEPEDSSTINGGKMKRFTGCPVVNARGMYKSQIYPVNLLCTIILECNKKPKIDARTDQAIYERVISVPFESSFLSADRVDPENKIFEGNAYLKSHEFKDKHKYALFKYLMEWGKKNWTGDIYIAQKCKDASRNYVDSQDDLIGWLSQNYQITESELDRVKFKDIYESFKNHIEYDRLSVQERKRWRRNQFKEALDATDYNVKSTTATEGKTLTYLNLREVDD
mgnify:CR=1 FL=1